MEICGQAWGSTEHLYLGFNYVILNPVLLCGAIQDTQMVSRWLTDSVSLIDGPPPFKFVIAVCGFTFGDPLYNDLCSLKIETPIFLTIARIDGVVAESQSLRLRDSSTNTALYFFEGTHHFPRDGGFLESLTPFLEDTLGIEETRSHED
ncbi:hypothetical protein N7463_000164 [Penicillium fimorum]|uniref:Serine hydrolase domain-containing protein n=1 Tax=Penicillium fimorum TaxID=1882269 RepID=A0A9W9Y3Z8_9EURO|nr:hypothetical protein N7463_000164 [Penicillium fimorum]